jgi:hypothetical protein
LNERYRTGLSVHLPSHKIGKVGFKLPGAKQNGGVVVVHPAESGTGTAEEDIMVMT